MTPAAQRENRDGDHDDDGTSREQVSNYENSIDTHEHQEVSNQSSHENEDDGLIAVTEQPCGEDHGVASVEQEDVIESEPFSKQHWMDFVVLQIQYLSTLLVFGLIIPTLMVSTWIVYDITGRIWPTTPFAIHFVLTLILAWYGCIWNHTSAKEKLRSFFVYSRRQPLSTPSSDDDREQHHVHEPDVVQDATDQESTHEGNSIQYSIELYQPTSNNDAMVMSQSNTPLLAVLLGRQETVVTLSYIVLSLLLDYYLFDRIYQNLLNILIDTIYTDIDGSTILEWTTRRNIALVLRGVISTIVLFRIVVVCIWLSVVVLGCGLLWGSVHEETRTTTDTIINASINTVDLPHAPLLSSNNETRRHPAYGVLASLKQKQELHLSQFFKPLHRMTSIGSMVWLGVCFMSCLSHLTDWIIPPSPNQIHCDPLDHIECSLPFPSFHHMVQDNTTFTGWKVELRSQSLPILRSGHTMNSWDFINDNLDGFSTMAPILFAALDGMLDAFMYQSQGNGDHGDGRVSSTKTGLYHAASDIPAQLVAKVDNIRDSLTNKSITLLINVKTQELVPHTAEIDFRTVLSERKNETSSSEESSTPLILVIPAQPLNHSTHYAVAVAGATSVGGTILPPTPGMRALLEALKVETVVDPNSYTTHDVHRLKRYRDVVLPALTRAAPWMSSETGNLSIGTNTDDSASSRDLQLLFDFVTVSEEAQLAPIRVVRDAAIRQVSSGEHRRRLNKIRVVKLQDYKCPFQRQDSDNEMRGWKSALSEGHAANDPTPDRLLVARTIHAELDVPWFLNHYGSGHRDAILLPLHEIRNVSQKMKLGVAKFVIHVPCSLKAAALLKNEQAGHNSKSAGPPAHRHREGRPLRAIVEIGHGMFYNRHESHEYPFMRVAHDEGYLIVAMDWRGMSSFDLPVVIKTLLSKPESFQAIRDNLIQGYANKIALQYWIQHGRLLEQEWLQFSTDTNPKWPVKQSPEPHLHPIPAYLDQPPNNVFYGSSQGGILGAGYTTLLESSPISFDRAVLGVPGIGFSVVLTRSRRFSTYDDMLLSNFFNNRHVRIILSILQMAWDPVEGAGQLAGNAASNQDVATRSPEMLTGGSYNGSVHMTKERRYPRTLLQAGLGDPVINRKATEALARAYRASILPNNPKQDLFDIPIAVGTNSSTWKNGPYVTLTQLLYKKEYSSLPSGNVRVDARQRNDVHICLRQDCPLIAQMSEFINTGKIINPCGTSKSLEDGVCFRDMVACYIPWKRNPTKPSNWTCDTSSNHTPITL